MIKDKNHLQPGSAIRKGDCSFSGIGSEHSFIGTRELLNERFERMQVG